MPVVCVGPDYLDDEVHSLISIMNRGGWQPHEMAIIRRGIQSRSEYVRAGLGHPTAKYWTGRIQREIDDRTRMRWDLVNGWTLDRWAEGRWQVVGVLGNHCIMTNLIDYLREHDMQRWPSPQAYLEHKRALAQAKQFENWSKGCQKLGAVIDNMSDRQIKEFINVERAMQTGETVTMHGATNRMYRRMAKASRNAPAPPANQGVNPGHRFKVLKRKSGGLHRTEMR